MRWVRPEILLFALVALTGCASIISGRTQEVSFTSNPEGATVTVNGRIIGKTPLMANLQKKSEQSLVFSKDGYKTPSMALETSIDGWFWGNIVLGGVIGSTTDGITGSVHKYAPSQYMVTLEPDGTNKMDGSPPSVTSRRPRNISSWHTRVLLRNSQRTIRESVSVRS